MHKHYMSKDNKKHVIRVSETTNKGFAIVTKGQAKGMDRITESSLEDGYELCSKEHFTKHYGKGKKYGRD